MLLKRQEAVGERERGIERESEQRETERERERPRERERDREREREGESEREATSAGGADAARNDFIGVDDEEDLVCIAR